MKVQRRRVEVPNARTLAAMREARRGGLPAFRLPGERCVLPGVQYAKPTRKPGQTGWEAWLLGFEGVHGQGRTQRAAYRSLLSAIVDAATTYLEDARYVSPRRLAEGSQRATPEQTAARHEYLAELGIKPLTPKEHKTLRAEFDGKLGPLLRDAIKRALAPRNRMRPVHPGEVLSLDFLEPTGHDERTLARMLGVPVKRVEDILAYVEPVTPDIARRLGKLLGMGAESWLNLQKTHDERQDALDLEAARKARREPAKNTGRAHAEAESLARKRAREGNGG